MQSHARAKVGEHERRRGVPCCRHCLPQCTVDEPQAERLCPVGGGSSSTDAHHARACRLSGAQKKDTKGNSSRTSLPSGLTDKADHHRHHRRHQHRIGARTCQLSRQSGGAVTDSADAVVALQGAINQTGSFATAIVRMPTLCPGCSHCWCSRGLPAEHKVNRAKENLSNAEQLAGSATLERSKTTLRTHAGRRAGLSQSTRHAACVPDNQLPCRQTHRLSAMGLRRLRWR
eukprot:COSAG03_NODE_1868_length_3407_cov_2.060762_2_plen_231_part_00